MVRTLALAIVLASALYLGFELLTFPDVRELKTGNPETTAFMERRKQQLRDSGEDDTLAWRWVPYERISRSMRRAVLVAEDDAFYQHEGVDVKGLKEALRRDWEQKRLAYGGSTITQQLAKNLYLSPSKNPLRKVKELLIAKQLEKYLSKKRILEIYLNVVELGERVYGVDAAARHYFRKPASRLSPREAALLAGCLPNPRVMNPAAPNKRLRFRQRMILSRMKRWGYLAERNVLRPKPLPPDPQPEPQTEPVPATDSSLTSDTAALSTGEPPPTSTSSTTDPTTPPAIDSTSEPPPTTETTTTEPPPPTAKRVAGCRLS